jgi:hypothetical protein
LQHNPSRSTQAQPALQVALVAVAGLAGGAIGLATGGIGNGLVGLGAGLLLGALGTLWRSAAQSEAAFFERYSEEHGMTNETGRLRMPPATPLLREGDARYASRVLEGELAPGCTGFLAHYSYEEHAADGRENRLGPRSDFTIAFTEVLESVPFVPELYCRLRSGPRLLEWLDEPEHPMQPVELESAVLGERCEILVSELQDPNWMRELFSPGFIVWLTESAPEDLSFELFGGRLCCYVPGHRRTEPELAALRAAAGAISSRIREECREQDRSEAAEQ